MGAGASALVSNTVRAARDGDEELRAALTALSDADRQELISALNAIPAAAAEAPTDAAKTVSIPRPEAKVEGCGSQIGVPAYVEWRSEATGKEGWDEAALKIVELLKSSGVRKGQVISIDATNARGSFKPIMSAFYSTSLPDEGPLDIAFEGDGGLKVGWAQIYEKAVGWAQGKDVISMTGCSDGSGSVSVYYVFFNKGVETNDGKIEWVESRAGSWNGAANGLIKKLHAADVQDGQILNIDAHNNGPSEAAIFSAFYCKTRVARGPLKLAYQSWNEPSAWEGIYCMATDKISDLALHQLELTAVTGALNEGNRNILYLFMRESSVSFVECRGGAWNPTADAIIQKLRDAGVRRGQVLGIDAHNSGENEQAIFSAYYDLSLPDLGELSITYNVQNSNSSWAAIYEGACGQAQGKDVISMTGSINTSDRSVFYVFYYEGQAPAGSQRPCLDQVVSVESRGNSWNEAAHGLIAKLAEIGVQDGQVVSIDAHNSGKKGAAIFSAHYSLKLEGRGSLRLTFQSQNTSASWAHMYGNAAMLMSRAPFKGTKIVGSATSSCNAGDRSVTYTFMQKATAVGMMENVKWVESRAGSWNKAADEIIQKLESAGVQRGQVLQIDAHNNGPDADAIFSAHYCLDMTGRGELGIKYSRTNSDEEWRCHYEKANEACEHKSVINITGSCNTGGRNVYYVFYYDGEHEEDVTNIRHVEVFHNNWSGAAQMIIAELFKAGVQFGQILSIDAKCSLDGKQACFSAHYSRSRNAGGKLALRYKYVQSGQGWKGFYDWGVKEMSKIKTTQFITFTTSIAQGWNTSVGFVFFQDIKAGAYMEDMPVKDWSLDGLWQVQNTLGQSYFCEVSDSGAELTAAGHKTDSFPFWGQGDKIGTWSGLKFEKDENTAKADFWADWSRNDRTGQIKGRFVGPRRTNFTATAQLTAADEESSWTGFMLKLLDTDATEAQRVADVDLQELKRKGPGEMPANPAYWGITVRQLQHLRAHMCRDGYFKRDGKFFDPSMYDINTDYVKPLTDGLNISLAVLYNRDLPEGGSRAKIFISHAWAESFLIFLATLETAIGSQNPIALSDTLWICTFGVYQNMTSEQIANAIAQPEDSPFAQVLSTVDECIVVFNDRVNIYSRVWCVYEAHLALDWDKIVRCIGLPPNWQDAVGQILVTPEDQWKQNIHSFCQSRAMKVAEAQASNPNDLRAIMSQIDGKHDKVDGKTNCLAEWALKDLIVGEFQSMGL